MKPRTVSYSPMQLKAIATLKKNLQIIACAGSGKTQVISARIINALKDGKTRPANVIAFTFTEKAGGELKDRIHQMYKEAFGTEKELADMYVGTIHGWCLNILQSAPVYKYLNHTILPEIQQKLFVDRNSKKSGLTVAQFLADGANLERYKHTGLYLQALDILREGDVDLKEVPESLISALASYQKLCDEKRHFDFSEVLVKALGELQINKQLRKWVKETVKFLVVDEYQDVNPAQERLVLELQSLGANLCVVGDDDQTIYQWRGSDLSNIISFGDRYKDVLKVPLEENYRSSPAIVQAANEVAGRIATRLAKKMISKGIQTYERGDIEASAFASAEAEAEWVAAKIKSLIGTEYQDKEGSPKRGLSFSDFAILLRSVKRDAPPILAALREAGLDAVVINTESLFEQEEVIPFQLAYYYLSGIEFRDEGETTIAQVRTAFADSGLGRATGQIGSAMKYLRQRRADIEARSESRSPVVDAEIYLQTVFLGLLEKLEITEESIQGSGKHSKSTETIFYNLGRFSEVISDYEQVHFNSNPVSLYDGFAMFLKFNASSYYTENSGSNQFVAPDAVQILTVHRAKGMQWPAVFLPALTRNKFPNKRQGGRGVWHILPEVAVENSERYRGAEDDERRLFYVALTRAEKYLYCSWAPVPGSKLYTRPGSFFEELNVMSPFGERGALKKAKLPPRPRKEDELVDFTFSELKYFFECPYQFKLRFLYGFNVPLSRAMGYGKSLHAALAEVHSEAKNGKIIDVDSVPELIDRHLHTPFAGPKIRENLRAAGVKAVTMYLKKHGERLMNLHHVEKPIELQLGEGVLVKGRIDLIRKAHENEIVVVDFKSDDKAQEDQLTRIQLQIYALGFEQQTGEKVEKIEIHDLKNNMVKVEKVDKAASEETKRKILGAATDLKANAFSRHVKYCGTCEKCDVRTICATGRMRAS